MKIFKIFLLSILIMNTNSKAQLVINLYENVKSGIPNARPCDEKEVYQNDGLGRVSKVTNPTLTVFLPKVPNPAASSVLICPGGGYGVVAVDHEGYDVAQALNEMGIAAFVLKYRLPNDACMTNKEVVPLMDAQQAMKIVRENASKWKIDAGKIGVMGFSAGGHLASTFGTHFNQSVISNPANVSLRPDFMILIYPVISFKDSITHRGSKGSLIGKNPSPQLVRNFSNEEQVTAQTPPTFLVHAQDDDVVPVANSIKFLEALTRNKVGAEMHVYPKGGHGFGMHNRTTKEDWMRSLTNWLLMNGFLK
ncbi:MAG: alpha/beta hydrolase [Segetibacter sp.]|nr:alpha/beta hydrolase [Segetibacter sp.]